MFIFELMLVRSLPEMFEGITCKKSPFGWEDAQAKRKVPQNIFLLETLSLHVHGFFSHVWNHLYQVVSMSWPMITDFMICLPNLAWSYDFFLNIWVLLPFVIFCRDQVEQLISVFTLDITIKAEGPCDWPFRCWAQGKFFVFFFQVEPMTSTLLHDRFCGKKCSFLWDPRMEYSMYICLDFWW